MLARVNKALNKFRELKSVLCAKKIGVNIKGKVYEACVRSGMIYGGERWAMTVGNVRNIERTEMRMLKADIYRQIARQTRECRFAEQTWH